MLNFTILMFGPFQIVDPHREEKLHQEISRLREELSLSLDQNAEFSVECDRLKQKLTNISSLISRQENRFQHLQESYHRLEEKLRLLQEKGRQEDHIQIQELKHSVEELQNNYQHVLSLIHADNLK